MIRALLFDVFGTVVDWRTGIADAVLRAGLDVDPIAFADAWRARYEPKMEEVRSGGRPYAPLDVLHRENLDHVLEKLGLEDTLCDAEKTLLNQAWERLPPWSDSVLGLTRLKAGYIIAPNSNGSIALMTRLAKFGDLPWDAILGADLARDYKPEPVVYRACVTALGLAPEEVMMVAAHNSDLEAARACGLATAFFPRPTEYGENQTKDLKATSDWDLVAQDLVDLSTKLVP